MVYWPAFGNLVDVYGTFRQICHKSFLWDTSDCKPPNHPMNLPWCSIASQLFKNSPSKIAERKRKFPTFSLLFWMVSPEPTSTTKRRLNLHMVNFTLCHSSITEAFKKKKVSVLGPQNIDSSPVVKTQVARSSSASFASVHRFHTQGKNPEIKHS